MRDPHAKPVEHDAACPNCRHPVETIEPVEEAQDYRMAAKRMAFILNRAALFIITANNPRLASWQVAYAIGLPICEGVSMTERGAALGLERATFSKGAKEFCRSASLPPSEYMKREESTGAYSSARVRQLSSSRDRKTKAITS